VSPTGTHEVRARRPDDEHDQRGLDHDHDHDENDHDHHRDGYGGNLRGRKRRSLLRDLFDF
jgi:hypothetical protein